MGYDLQRYDLSALQTNEKERLAFFFCSVSASAGTSKENDRSVNFDHSLLLSVEMNPCWFRKLFNTNSVLSASGLVDVAWFRRCRIENESYTNVELIKDVSRVCNAVEQMDGSIHLSRISDKSSIAESFAESEVILRYNNLRNQITTESLLAFVEVISFTVDSMLCNLTIPAGSTLVIDMNNRTAYLDGVNVFSKIKSLNQKWLSFGPHDQAFIVDVGSGGQVQGAVVYTERYL